MTCKSLVLAAVAAFALAGPAFAAKRSFSIPTSAMTPMMQAFDAGMIVLENTGTPMVRINFSLPVDYKAGSTVKLRLTFASDKTCNSQISIYGAMRARPGTKYSNSVAGITVAGGGAMTMKADVVSVKTVEIRPAANFAGQKPGDYFALILLREADAFADNCSSFMALLHGEIRYITK
jgi:hypothetical protein